MGAPAEVDEGRRRPLTLVEELILASNRLAAPVTIGLVAATTTRLDPRRLDAALAGAVAAHPVVAARLAVGAVGATWLTPRGARIDVVEVDCDSEAAVWDALARACSYSFTPDSPGQLRVVLARRAGGDALVLAAHHAAMDGNSLATLLRLIMRGYEGVDSVEFDRPATASTAAVYASAASRSSSTVYSSASGSGSGSGLGSGLGSGSMKPQTQTPPRQQRRLPTVAARIAPDRSSGPLVTWIRRHLVMLPVDDCYGVHGVSIDLPRLGTLPDGSKPTVNDALVAAAHLTVDRWNTSRSRTTGTVQTRLGVNLRTATEVGVVANLSGEIMVASDAADRGEPVRMLAAVRRQTAAAKQADRPRRQPVDPLQPLGLLSPRTRAAMLRAAVATGRRLLMPTATVTNLGRIEDPLANLPADVLADRAILKITDVHFAAFAGPPQGVIVGAAGFGNRLHLTFSHHTAMLDARAARRFAAVYLDALHDVSRGRRHRFGRQAGRRVAVSEADAERRVVPTA